MGKAARDRRTGPLNPRAAALFGAVCATLLLGSDGTPAAAPQGVRPVSAPSTTQAPQATKPSVCLIEPDTVIDVGSQVVGVVDRVHVRRGDKIAKGQKLVSLRSDVERAQADVARQRSQIDAEVGAAQAALVLAEQKWRRADALVASNFVSDQAAEQARAEREVAVQKLNLAMGQHQVSRLERRVVDAQLDLRSVRSPIGGVVVERYVNAGERVEERPLLRVASIDPLRVELMVPSSRYGSVTEGDKLTIHPELPGAAAVSAKVEQVDRVMDAASNTFRVRLSLPNPGYRLPAGLRCRADLPGDAAGATPAGNGPHASSGATAPSNPRLTTTVVQPRPITRAAAVME